MSEDTQRTTSQVPAGSWPWIVAGMAIMLSILFYDNRKLRSEIKESNRELQAVKDKALEDERNDNAAIRRQNEFLTRLLYTSENMAKFIYTDSITLANRTAAGNQSRATN